MNDHRRTGYKKKIEVNVNYARLKMRPPTCQNLFVVEVNRRRELVHI